MNNNNVSIPYLKKVITDEMRIDQLEKQRYYPFEETDYLKTIVSKPFRFINTNPLSFLDIDPPILGPKPDDTHPF